ncbi:MAG: hypothetical protein ABWX96_13560 [Propionibacteriaceae bacterium]
MTSPDEPIELKEYEYYVGHTLVTAQLGEKQAERMGAVPAGSGQLPKPEVGHVENRDQARANPAMAEPDAKGTTNESVDSEALDKARETRNRRSR